MIKILNPAPFQSAVRAISSFISEGNFRFNEKGISFKAIDPSQIVLVSYEAPKASFEKFDIEPNLVGLGIDELNKVIRRAAAGETISLDLEESYLKVLISGSLERTFRLPLLDVLEEEPSIPVQEYDATIEMPAKLIQEALKDASLFESSVVFRVENSKLSIEARGSHGMLRTESKNPELVKVKSKSDIVGKYSLNFLETIVREAEPTERILFELKNEAPMRITYKIGNSKLQFHLAHMIL